MITLRNISKIYGEDYLFDNVNLTICENEKIGIVGRNGVGKSTLLKIIQNDELATSGEVIYSNKTIGFLSQEKQLELTNTINDEIKQMQEEHDKVFFKMEEILSEENFSNDERLIKSYGELEVKYQQMGGYEIESRIKKILGIFGISKNMYTSKISELSGGQKTRLAMIKLIIKDYDYLILDEPTNHLDVSTIEWLEDFLRLKAKAVIIVSHDRFFLQKVCNKIVEIENSKLEIYNSKYTNYIEEKKTRYDFNLNSYNNQQMEIKKIEEFIQKNNKKVNKVGQVRDRKKKLERMELIAEPRLITEKVKFDIVGFKLKKAHYVDMIDVTIGYEDKPILKNINFTIRGGDRIGIIGENGCGKSTLIKTITKELKVLKGNSILHPKIKIGYFEQEETSLDPDKTVYDTIEELMKDQTTTMIRKHLANFLFKGKDVFKKVGILSGGEKVRLIFATFVLRRYDMIIMDEPTNHLDLNAKEELEAVLKQFVGTLLVISHDRYFINQVVNKIFFIDGKEYHIYEGDYNEYLKYKSNIKDQKIKKIKKSSQKKKININKLKNIEKEIEKKEHEKKEILQIIEDPKMYNDWQKLKVIKDEIENIDNELEKLYNSLLES